MMRSTVRLCQHQSTGKVQKTHPHLIVLQSQQPVLLMVVELPRRNCGSYGAVWTIPPRALPPPRAELPIPMVVALSDRSEFSDVSDGSTTDTVIFEGDSEAGVEEFSQSRIDEEVEFAVPRVACLRRAFASLDEVDPCAQFQQRARVMRSVPRFLVGMFKNALKIALGEIVRTDDEVTQERG